MKSRTKHLLAAAVALLLVSWSGSVMARGIHTSYYTPQFYGDYLVFYDESGAPIYYEDNYAYAVPGDYQDYEALVNHFLDKYTRQMNKRVTGISNGAMRALLHHEWRGNVRELENVIERAVIFAEGEQILVEHLPFATADMADDVGEALKEALRQFERQHIIYSLRRHKYDKPETANHLGIAISSLYRKLEELNIPKNLEELDTTATTNA